MNFKKVWLGVLAAVVATAAYAGIIVHGQLIDASAENLSADPTSYTGRFYLNTTAHTLKFYTGSAWRTVVDTVTALSNPMTTQGDILYTDVTPAPARLAKGTATQVLHSGSTPSWAGVSLTADVTGVLPVANIAGPASASVHGYLSSADWTTFNNESTGNITTGLVFLGGGFASTTFTTGRYFQRNKWVNIIVQASGTRNGGGGTANVGTLTLPFTSARSFNALIIHADSVLASSLVACAQFVASSATLTFFTGMDCTGGAGNNTAIHTYNIDLWYEST